jgi:peroxiredoxin
MEPALLVARIVLAAVFATAGVAKLADLAGSRRAVADFGAPRWLAGPLGTVLPLVELGVAGALLASGSGRGGALASLALLLAFSAAIALNLIRGRAPECRCFGRLHSAPVSWLTVARNGLFALVATGLVWESAPAGMLLAAAGTALAVTALGRRRGRAPATQGLPVGAIAPDFRLFGLEGAKVSLGDLLAAGKPLVLVFTDPRCGPCVALAPPLSGWQRDPARELAVWVVARGDPVENRAKAEEHGLRNVLLDPDRRVADAYRALGTPSAVLVGADGRVASRLAAGGEAIERLLSGRRALPSAARAGPAAVGVRLTRFELLVRAAGVAGVVLASGAGGALAGVIPITIQCRYVRCGNRCCPKKAVCGRRRGKKVCICPDGREACGSKCCPETFVCGKTARGKKVCICPPRTRLCRGRCVPFTDPAHCGGCGRECPPATVCVNGECVGGDGTGTGPGGAPPCECPPGQTCCDGACTDLNRSELHCGRCDRPCPEGRTCCDGECRDLQADPDNCGQCGKRCPAGKVCAAGRCAGECPPGLENCGGRCVDPKADLDHCGACGHPCDLSDFTPIYGCCGGECVDLTRSNHCGACFRECPAQNPSCTCQYDGTCTGEPGCPDNDVTSGRGLGRSLLFPRRSDRPILRATRRDP